MKIKSLIKILFFTLVITFFGTSLMGCQKTNNNPKDLIQNEYGKKQFRISFNAENLDKPLESIYYSSKYIPQLPTPEKLGYIFTGWFFDKDYQYPFNDSHLLSVNGLKDVILYAKWQKERLNQNGIYDLNLSASIVEDSIIKNSLSDAYSGYKDFSKQLIHEDIHIEKSSDKTLLKLVYDDVTTVLFGGEKPFKVSLSQSLNDVNKISLYEKIDDATNKVKTIFLDITKFDLTTPIYLHVSALNYHDKEIDTLEKRNETTTNYDVKINITKFLGFKTGYMNADNKLDDGIYLAKVFFRQLQNESTMMQQFNSVYSYIVAKDGNYKLIRQFNPYFGLIANENDLTLPKYKYFSSRAMTILQYNSFYEIDEFKKPINNKIEVEFFPEKYNATNQRGIEVEFHAKDNKYWQIFDLGKNIKSYVIRCSVTGFMEQVGKKGYLDQLMLIEKDQLIKIPEMDFKPLESKDAYCFSKQVNTYYGFYTDLENNNVLYNDIKKNGLSFDFVNFFYTPENLADTDKVNKLYSHKMKTYPDDNNFIIKDNRGKITKTNIEYEIYGYNQNDVLIQDSLNSNKYYVYGIREKNIHKVGKTCKIGDIINVEKLFANKVKPLINASNITYKAHRLNSNNNIIYDNIVNITKEFLFSEKIAILYNFKDTIDGCYKNAVIYLDLYQDPVINIVNSDGSSFDSTKEYDFQDTVFFPRVTYNWLNKVGKFTDNWYDEEPKSNSFYRNLNHSFLFYEENGVCKVNTNVTYHDKSFKIVGGDAILYYEISNVYGETYPYIIRYKIKRNSNTHYDIVCSDGSVISKGHFYKTSEGEVGRIAVSKSYLHPNPSALDNYKPLTYNLKFLDKNLLLSLKQYKIKSFKKDIVYTLKATDTIENIINEIKTTIGNDFSFVSLVYENDKHSLVLNILLNSTISGRHTQNFLNHPTYFKDIDYQFFMPEIIQKDGSFITKANHVKVERVIGDISSYDYNLSNSFYKLTNNKDFFTVSFYDVGYYYVTYYFNDFFYSYFRQLVKVCDNLGDVNITYLTDGLHPFKDGSTSKTLTYSLSQNFKTIDSSFFQDSEDKLFSFNYKHIELFPGKYIYNYIDTFNSENITLTAYWDRGISYTIDYDKTISGKDPDVKKVYLFPENSHKTYHIKLPIVKDPDGYVFIGLQTSLDYRPFIFKEDIIKTHITVTSDITVKAIYRRKSVISYEIDKTKSSTHFINDDYFIGDKILYKTVTPKQGYKFLGWYLKEDATMALIDFNTFTITSPKHILVAKFSSI